MEGTPLADVVDLLGPKSLTLARWCAHLSLIKLRAVLSLLGASGTASDTNHDGVPVTVLQLAVH